MNNIYILNSDSIIQYKSMMISAASFIFSLIALVANVYYSEIEKKEKILYDTFSDCILKKLPEALSNQYKDSSQENIDQTIKLIGNLKENLLGIKYYDRWRYNRVIQKISDLEDIVYNFNNDNRDPNKWETMEKTLEKTYKLLIRPKY